MLDGELQRNHSSRIVMEEAAASLPERCNFWLPRKNRFCANLPINDSPFCGNHNPKLEQDRLPCPLDPSHSVLRQQIEKHLKVCPFLKQAESLRLQPFYKKGINAGTCQQQEIPTSTSLMKRNAVHQMTATQFLELTNTIKSIHASLCLDLPDSYRISQACKTWLKTQADGKLPFQEKHVLQQASILGNLEEFGVLTDSSHSSHHHGIPAVVEFGAGRGYLTQMLADCYGIHKVFLVERRSYKLKADRSLRQIESLVLERLRIDIEDLDLDGVASLKGVPYLAIGKHLCGPATDLTLRCCLHEHSFGQDVAVDASENQLRGLAIATCCHHLCQWKHYINKSYLSDMGITEEAFHAITWFTSWAVDGDHSSDLYDMGDQRSSVDSVEMNECSDNVRGVEGIVRDMPSVERAVLGSMCKDIIDMGRLMWIKRHGLGARLVKYVPSNISPENHLLVATNCNYS